MTPIRPPTHHVSRFTSCTFAIFYFLFAIPPVHATQIFGNLTDISLAPLNTKMMFSPTNEVMIAQSGLSAGPPKIINTPNGAFSLPLEPGNYTVSLPMIPWRHPFGISVFDSPTPVNITNLLTNPRTYSYTNPFVPPLHVNTDSVIAWSTNGDVSLLDSPAIIAAGTLATGRTITIEAFGTFDDPQGNSPDVSLKLKLGSTTILTQTRGAGIASWHLRALLTVRSSGPTGVVAATLAMTLDNSALPSWTFETHTATVDTTVAQTIDLTASISNFTDAEAIHCDQLAITLD